MDKAYHEMWMKRLALAKSLYFIPEDNPRRSEVKKELENLKKQMELMKEESKMIEMFNGFDVTVSETAAMFFDDKESLRDRMQFVKNFGVLLSQTRESVIDLDLRIDSEKGTEDVVITFKNGYQKSVNVRLDSYTAIMRDVLKNL